MRGLVLFLAYSVHAGQLQLTGTENSVEFGMGPNAASLTAKCTSQTAFVGVVDVGTTSSYYESFHPDNAPASENVTLYLRNVPVSCVMSAMDEPCHAHAPHIPSLFFCVYDGAAGSTASGPYRTGLSKHMEGDTLIAMELHLGCPLPSYETLVTITGYGGDNSVPVSVNISAAHAFSAAEAPSKKLLYRGVPGGDVLTFTGLPGPPPPLPPSLPPSPLPSPPLPSPPPPSPSPPAEFNWATDVRVLVAGSGYELANGVYFMSTTVADGVPVWQKPNGDQDCSDGEGVGCCRVYHSGDNWEWGIQCEGHHRWYTEGCESNGEVKPNPFFCDDSTWTLRENYGSGSIPTVRMMLPSIIVSSSGGYHPNDAGSVRNDPIEGEFLPDMINRQFDSSTTVSATFGYTPAWYRGSGCSASLGASEGNQDGRENCCRIFHQSGGTWQWGIQCRAHHRYWTSSCDSTSTLPWDCPDGGAFTNIRESNTYYGALSPSPTVTQGEWPAV